MHTSMNENLKRGIAQGIYREDINIDFISRIYFSGVNGSKDAQLFPDSIFKMEEVTLQFLEYHLRAIVTAKGLDVLTKTIAEISVQKN
jgi:hypothetical protein